MTYRYYVVVTAPSYKDDVYQELINVSTGGITVPDRPVNCVNPRPHNEYVGEFELTLEEAELLKTDYRIADVHRDPLEMGAKIVHHTVQLGNFSKDTTGVVASELNWGLARCTATTEPFGTNTVLNQFPYNLTGAGVDIVLLDTGILKFHPEFAVNADGTGGSRVIDVDWSQYGIMPSNGTGSWVGDVDGHGSNCASIAAGNTNGWAKDANIYVINIIDSTNLSNTYTDPVSAYETIRAWHLAKPVTSTGYRRPTVCSNSWGYDIPYSGMTGTNYQGVMHVAGGPNPLYGQIPPYGGQLSEAQHGIRVTAIESTIASCQNAGIVFVGSAGNDSMKVDVPGGVDYNNYWIDNANNTNYYHRGTTPSAATGVLCVGAISQATPEHKISFSNTGPRVDVFSPGNYIMGAYSNNNYLFNAVADPRSAVSTSTNTTFYLNKISGTSQACPQVTGIVACLLQARPFYNQSMVNNFIKTTYTTGLLNETYYGATTATVYLNYASLQGATNAILYQLFNNPYPTSISSS
jgi:hypothetical protein